jgi:hypothetical protein
MAQIGRFIRTGNGFSGRLRTLSLDIELTIVPADHSDAENAPNYRVHAGDEDGPEVGAVGPAPAKRPASMSRSRSMIPGSRSRSAPTCSSPAAIAPHSICSGRAPRSAKAGADRAAIS